MSDIIDFRYYKPSSNIDTNSEILNLTTRFHDVSVLTTKYIYVLYEVYKAKYVHVSLMNHTPEAGSEM
jgi:hypothetical protein